MAGPRIIVLIKAVPDIERVKFDQETGRIDRSSAQLEPNPFDLNALEAALRIKERLGGIITALSMGPPQAETVLRDAIARGADKAILLTDEAFAGSDTLATSRALVAGIRKTGEFDLVIAGEKSVDGDTGQVGSEVASLLGLPSDSYVDSIEDVTDNRITVTCDYGTRRYVRESTFPCVISVTKNVASPRLPKLADALRSRKAKIEINGASDLGEFVDRKTLGTLGSPTHVMKIRIGSESRRDSRRLAGSPTEVAKELADLIEYWLHGGKGIEKTV